ncbi:hypothetical protein GQ42DRAFT_67488 [Ramicandelaber brevisporus]|nr:hypothetical protein GQ42DRAFT_67488 [Ramicandelaber brevisporus]
MLSSKEWYDEHHEFSPKDRILHTHFGAQTARIADSTDSTDNDYDGDGGSPQFNLHGRLSIAPSREHTSLFSGGYDQSNVF